MRYFVLVAILAFVVSPIDSVGQPLSEADTIRFQLPESSQFLPGRAGIPEALKRKLARAEIEKRKFDKLWIIGTYDEMNWRRESCDLQGDIPLQASWSARQDQCDASIAGRRAEAVAQYINDMNWTNPLKVYTRRLLDEYERSVLLIFTQEDEKLSDNFKNRLERIEAKQDSLEDKTEEIAESVKKNKRDISALKRKIRHFPKFSAFIGVGAQQFARILTPGLEAGIRLGRIEIAGWYGYRNLAGTVKLPEPDGVTKYGRSGYGGSVTWYPRLFRFRKTDIGVTVASEHAEDFLQGREQFVTVYESVQAGIVTDVGLSNIVSLGAQLKYAVIKNAKVPDLAFGRSPPQWSGRITLRINLGN